MRAKAKRFAVEVGWALLVAMLWLLRALLWTGPDECRPYKPPGAW